MQDVKLLIEDIGELKPTIFCAVPRVMDRVYSGIYSSDLSFQSLIYVDKGKTASWLGN